MATATAEPSARLALTLKLKSNKSAARVAAISGASYKAIVKEPGNVAQTDKWLDTVVPRIVKESDISARDAAAYYGVTRKLEIGDSSYTATPSLGAIDDGVRGGLGELGMMQDKIERIKSLDLPTNDEVAMLRSAQDDTAKNIVATTIRYAQAGGRKTIVDNSTNDKVAIGYVRVTSAKPCAFCAMLAGRGIEYRPYREGAFDKSNARFEGEGNAKVHNSCGCSLKPVFTKDDAILKRNGDFANMWLEWGAGGGGKAAIKRFTKGYEYWAKTGEYKSWEWANGE